MKLVECKFNGRVRGAGGACNERFNDFNDSTFFLILGWPENNSYDWQDKTNST